ncbi:MAG: hypothetical protein GY853_16440 [PVC group bacterium]|nr:hypothetical protein [PVC group bacterium]
MPYITKHDRDLLAGLQITFEHLMPVCHIGEINFLITDMLLCTKPETYQDFNELIGLLECVKLEFYRRAVAIYEDKKKEENGDVYE